MLGTMSSKDSRLDMHYHLGQAIAIVNKRISNCDYKAVTKETVMAITWLTNMGVCNIPPSAFIAMLIMALLLAMVYGYD